MSLNSKIWNDELDDFLIKECVSLNDVALATELTILTGETFTKEMVFQRRRRLGSMTGNANSIDNLTRILKFQKGGGRNYYLIRYECIGKYYIGILLEDPYTFFSAKSFSLLRKDIYSKLRSKSLPGTWAQVQEVRRLWNETIVPLDEIRRRVDIKYIKNIIRNEIWVDPAYVPISANKRGRIYIEISNVRYSLKEISVKYDVPVNILYNRYEKGESYPEIIRPFVRVNVENMRDNLLAVGDEIKSLKDWMEDARCTISWNTLKKRFYSLPKTGDVRVSDINIFKKVCAGRPVRGDKP